MSELCPWVHQRFFDDNGDPLAGGKVYTYVAGSSTPQLTYTDEGALTANTNPIILDAGGKADIWIGGGVYKFVITDLNDVVIDTFDNIKSIPSIITAAINTAGSLSIAANLSDVADAAQARNNLGLGNSATKAVGTAAGTVAAGNDSRFTDSRAPNGSAGGDLTGNYPNPTIGANKVTNTQLAQIATQIFKGRITAGTGNVEDLTATQATAILNAFTGDSGSGGVKGLVPAPASGDSLAGKFLNAGGGWSVPAGGGGGASVNVSGTRAAPTLITAAGGIAFTGSNMFNIWFIGGNGGAVDITVDPQIATGTTLGQSLELIVPNGANTVTLEDLTGLDLNGTWVGEAQRSIRLIWDGSNWFEVSRR